MFDKLRMSSWLIYTALIAIAVYYIAPHQLKVAVWKLLLIAGAAYLGYWIDRNVFPYMRPHEAIGTMAAARIEGHPDRADRWAALAVCSMIRRAIIIAAVVIAAALAV